MIRGRVLRTIHHALPGELIPIVRSAHKFLWICIGILRSCPLSRSPPGNDDGIPAVRKALAYYGGAKRFEHGVGFADAATRSHAFVDAHRAPGWLWFYIEGY